MAKLVGMNIVHLPDDESHNSAIRDLTSTYVSENPGAFRCSDSEDQLFNVAEFDVMLKYIYDLQAMGYTQYVEGFGCQEWLDEIGPFYPDPRKPVIEEITMFAYAYEEGMIDPEWRVFNQIDTVYVYLRQNGWDTSSMSAEDGRRYDDGELGERVMTVRGPKGYADAFRAEYRRRYPDYDTILIRKDNLPERGQPVPEGVTREWAFHSTNTEAILRTLGYIDDAMRGENLGKLIYPPSPESWYKVPYDDIYVIPLTTETEEGQHFLLNYQEQGYYAPVWFSPWMWS